jgi:hypothetical protein
LTLHFGISFCPGSPGSILGRMICAECGREVERVCHVCQAARARRGLLRRQRRFLHSWLAGKLELRVKRKDGVLHLELFDDRWHSYCDVAMFDVTEHQKVREIPRDLCPECLKVLDELVFKTKSEGR